MEVEVSFTVLLSWRGLMSHHYPTAAEGEASSGDLMGVRAAQIDIHQLNQFHP
jgi:hypothetical protein